MYDNNSLYNLVKETIINLQNGSISFDSYLEVQSKFYKYSLANIMLILAQKPKAICLKDSLAWRRESVKVSKFAKPINILEPKFDEDGKIVDYKIKDMYDISQTNARKRNKKYDNRTILKAFLHNNVAEIKGVDGFDDLNIIAQHEISDNKKSIIYLKRGLDYKNIFIALSSEFASIELADDSDKEMYDFKKKIISYLICRSYDIDIKKFNIKKIPASFRNMSDINARRELVEIRNAVAKVNEGIDDYLSNINRDKNYVR